MNAIVCYFRHLYQYFSLCDQICQVECFGRKPHHITPMDVYIGKKGNEIFKLIPRVLKNPRWVLNSDSVLKNNVFHLENLTDSCANNFSNLAVIIHLNLI